MMKHLGAIVKANNSFIHAYGGSGLLVWHGAERKHRQVLPPGGSGLCYCDTGHNGGFWFFSSTMMIQHRITQRILLCQFLIP